MKGTLAALAVGQLTGLVAAQISAQGDYGYGYDENVAGYTDYYPDFGYQFCTQTSYSGLVSSSPGPSGSTSSSTTTPTNGVQSSTPGVPSSSPTPGTPSSSSIPEVASSSSSSTPIVQSSSASSTGSTPSASPTYLLSVGYSAPDSTPDYYRGKERRQTTGSGFYLSGASGAGASSSCLQASPFTLNNGQLESNGEYVSTQPGLEYSPFVVGPTTYDSITTLFSMTTNNTLEWSNPGFQPTGYAQFCALGNTVYACFNGEYPAGCLPVTIGAETTSACPGYGSSSTPSGSSSSNGGVAGSSSSIASSLPVGSSSSTVTGPVVGSSSSSSVNGASSGTIPGTTTSIGSSIGASSQSLSSGTSSPSPSASGNIYSGDLTGSLSGCYLDTSSPPLVGPNTTVSSLEECLNFCNSYSLLSVANGGDCVCANAFTLYAQEAQLDMSDCDYPCTGAPSETCGGDNAAQVYEISGDTTTVYGSSSSSSTTTAGGGTSSSSSTAPVNPPYGGSTISSFSFSSSSSSPPVNPPYGGPSSSSSSSSFSSSSPPVNPPYGGPSSSTFASSSSSSPPVNPPYGGPSSSSSSFSSSPSSSLLPSSSSSSSFSTSLSSSSFSLSSSSSSFSSSPTSSLLSSSSSSSSFSSSPSSSSFSSTSSAPISSSTSAPPSVSPSLSSSTTVMSSSTSIFVPPNQQTPYPTGYPPLIDVGNANSQSLYGLCPQYWGGQYSTGNGTLYEIDCYNNANYMQGPSNSDSNRPAAFSEVDYPTCVNMCDAYNAYNLAHGISDTGGTGCLALTWVEQSEVGSNNNCYLHGFTNAGSTTSNSAYDAKAITSFLIDIPVELYLSHPIPLVTNTYLNGFAYGVESVTELTLTGFTFDIFGTISDTVYVSSNGFISILPNGATSPTVAEMSSEDLAGTIPANNANIPTDTIFPLWTNSEPLPDGTQCQYEGSQYGVYYQQDGNLVSFEFLVADEGNGQAADYHYIVTYDQTEPEQWYFYYFDIETVTGSQQPPPTFTIGGQGTDAVQNPVNITIAQQIPDDGAHGGPTSGTIYHLDTTAPIDSSGGYTTDSFNPSSISYVSWPQQRPAGAGYLRKRDESGGAVAAAAAAKKRGEGERNKGKMRGVREMRAAKGQKRY